MMRTLERLAIVAVALIGAVLIVAATRPDTFEVRRTARINASPERIFPLINDLRAFNSWNPYEKKDPNLVVSYSGPAGGKGASYAFKGNKDVGTGSIQIVESSPMSRVTMTLLMLEPFETRSVVEFVLEPDRDATNVTWAMHGRVPYLAKIVHLFFDVDGMVGGDFAAGLAGLKAIVESPAVASSMN
jgi:uncharacterized protein YndB with AHSA1/START domain